MGGLASFADRTSETQSKNIIKWPSDQRINDQSPVDMKGNANTFVATRE
jgi:hypothetical protein